MLVHASRRDDTAWSIMREFGIKSGSKSEGHLREEIQRIYNQRRTGAIGDYTWRHLMGQAGYVWVCLKWTDVLI